MATEKAIEKARPGVPFVKGTSGNPSGRPKRSATVTQYISEKTGEGRKIVDELWQMARDTGVRDRDRIRAMELLLERGFGKSVQPVAIGGEVSVVRELGSFSDLELMELVDIRKKLRGEVSRGEVIDGEVRVVV
jgi:hypothetical protein